MSPHRRRGTAAMVVIGFAVATLTACAGAPGGGPGGGPGPSATAARAVPSTTTGAGRRMPPTTGTFDYQLGGTAERVDAARGPADIDVVVRDAGAEPLPGAYNVCYVNGFQTQPGEADTWLARGETLLRDRAGGVVADPAWPDELVLDPSTPEQRRDILEVRGELIERCATAGFDAVEIDNLDTWTRFDGIDERGALALAASYVELAHAAGLAIAQKNAAEIARTARDDLGFDFAVVEECAAYDECGVYADVYGAHVLQVEYPEALAEAGLSFAEVCAGEDRAPLTILRDRGLVPPGHAGHVYAAC